MAAHGITPAWAGKRTNFPKRLCRRWDHPRVGGEKKRRALSVSAFLGSPPHGRGKVVLRQVAGAPAGITPAWAGKSICLALPITAPRDHPRVGGEKTRVFQQHFPAVGSPPHGRGKARRHPSCPRRSGITPAWAGKSTCRASMPTVSWDHPRTGGEKAELTAAVISAMGSPPRRRGKDFMFCGQHLEIRITPAWAGKRLTRPAMTGTPRDHPRVGGEKIRQSIWYSTT